MPFVRDYARIALPTLCVVVGAALRYVFTIRVLVTRRVIMSAADIPSEFKMVHSLHDIQQSAFLRQFSRLRQFQISLLRILCG